MKLEIKLATRRGDVLRCQYFIAEHYNRYYEIFFSNDIMNLDARIEPYPDRYIMGLIEGDLVAAAGLYLQRTYAEQYGDVTDEDVDAMIREAGVGDRYSAKRKREFTKLVIRDDWGGRGLAHHFFRGAHSRHFLQLDASPGEPSVILASAKISIFNSLYRSAGITTRLVKPFPIYQVHSLYSTPDDPMESRLIIPDIDIPSQIYDRPLPMECDFSPVRGAYK